MKDSGLGLLRLQPGAVARKLYALIFHSDGVPLCLVSHSLITCMAHLSIELWKMHNINASKYLNLPRLIQVLVLHGIVTP